MTCSLRSVHQPRCVVYYGLASSLGTVVLCLLRHGLVESMVKRMCFCQCLLEYEPVRVVRDMVVVLALLNTVNAFALLGLSDCVRYNRACV